MSRILYTWTLLSEDIERKRGSFSVELRAEERMNKILKITETKRFIKVEELASFFDVSSRTIRRDLEKLEQNGLLKRTYGGAVATCPDEDELTLDIRGDIFAGEKEKIGKAAAELIEDGDSLVLDSGTTVHWVAKHIKMKRDLIVVTNAINIVNELAKCENITLVVTGGTLRASTYSLVGAQTQEMLRKINVKWAFLGASGITERQGFTNTNLFEAEVKRAMIACAKKSVVLADHSKFGKVSFSNFASLTEVDHIITDSGASEEELKGLLDSGSDIIIVP